MNNLHFFKKFFKRDRVCVLIIYKYYKNLLKFKETNLIIFKLFDFIKEIYSS